MIGLTTQAHENDDRVQFLANPLKKPNVLAKVDYATVDGADNGIQPYGWTSGQPDVSENKQAAVLNTQSAIKNIQWAAATSSLFILGTRFTLQQPIDESAVSEIARLSLWIFIAKQFFHNDLSLYE